MLSCLPSFGTMASLLQLAFHSIQDSLILTKVTTFSCAFPTVFFSFTIHSSLTQCTLRAEDEFTTNLNLNVSRLITTRIPSNRINIKKPKLALGLEKTFLLRFHLNWPIRWQARTYVVGLRMNEHCLFVRHNSSHHSHRSREETTLQTAWTVYSHSCCLSVSAAKADHAAAAYPIHHCRHAARVYQFR